MSGPGWEDIKGRNWKGGHGEGDSEMEGLRGRRGWKELDGRRWKGRFWKEGLEWKTCLEGTGREDAEKEILEGRA